VSEQEWLACEDIQLLLEYMVERTSNRKFRLFGCACCRRIWDLLNEQSRNAVLVAERYADGLATEDEVEIARNGMTACCNETVLTPGLPAKFSWAYGAARLVLFDTPFWKTNSAEKWTYGAVWTAAEAAWRHNGEDGPASEMCGQLALLRDVFENPYQAAWIDHTDLTSTVIALVSQMYESRDFTTMPILADALQDAGCENVNILNHCRSKGVHVKGCWVVDLILGKE
jgi:hypothetical protein